MGKLLSSLCLLLILVNCQPKEKPLFDKIKVNHSHLDFQNQVFETETMNLAHNYYFYNGAGVTLCDFNQDGLVDVFLIGNHVPSKLYLNQGNFQFKEVTKQAGLHFNYWASGATYADVNGDKLPDIFVSTVGEGEPNLLFIHQGINAAGIPTFKEEAQAFGLYDTLISTQAAFLDYDRDNDLDLFIAVNSQLMNNRNELRARNLDEFNYTQDKFYRNNGDNTFTEVSEEVGITNEGYSLGIAINDLNNDGWSDIYVANDFISNDLIYINNQMGGFEEKAIDYLRHASQNGMGVDIADFNQDGLMDITVVDMMPKSNRRRKLMLAPMNYDLYEYRLSLGYIPQHVRNTIQLNNGADDEGNLQFSEIGCLAGVYSTDWSWAPLWADFDNNSTLDLYITNGYYKDLTDLDFSNGLYNQFGTDKYNKEKQLKDLASLRPIKESNYFYKNNGSLRLEDISKSAGITSPSFSHGAAFADLDLDGDLDLVVNNLGQEAFLYKNNTIQPGEKESKVTPNYLKIKLNGKGKNTAALGTRLKLKSKEWTQSYFHSNIRGYLSSMSEIIHFGLGTIDQVDSLFIYWPNGEFQTMANIQANQTITINQAPTNKSYSQIPTPKGTHFTDCTAALKLTHTHVENKFIDFKNDPLLLKMYSKDGPSMAVGDIDGDGKEDLIVGGAAGKPMQLFRQKTDQFQKESILRKDAHFEDMGMVLFDVDNDADLDLYVVSGGGEQLSPSKLYQDRLYLNTKGRFTKSENIPNIEASGGVVRGADFDKDGDIDLFTGGRVMVGAYPKAPKSHLLMNENGKLVDGTPDFIKKAGMISDALWTDFDGDGWTDLLIVGEWMSITFFKNQQGQLVQNDMVQVPHSSGWWNSVVAGDFDEDGDEDYLVGNLGSNTYITAAKNQPIRLYADDFDENGKIDPILSYFTQNDKGIKEEFALHTRDALTGQIVAYKRRFNNYKSFAEAAFTDVLKEHDRKNTQIYEATELRSIYLENLGNGQFDLQALPLACQIAPIYGMLVNDFNQDGHLDVLLTGNQNSAEPLFGNMDAANGIYLQGNGKGEFNAIPTPQSGLFLKGDQKSIVQLFVAEQPIVIAGANTGKLKAVKSKLSFPPQSEILTLTPLDEAVVITLENGQPIKRHFYYGTTFLSQSTRKIVLTPSMEKVLVINSKGERRKIR